MDRRDGEGAEGGWPRGRGETLGGGRAVRPRRQWRGGRAWRVAHTGFGDWKVVPISRLDLACENAG